MADACVRSARLSCQLLSQCWVNGEFHIFDYFYVQHLFSAAVILAIAGTLGRETSQDDNDAFNLAAGFLQQLEQHGNPAAMEFYSHIKGIQSTLATLRSAGCPPNALITPRDAGSQQSLQPLEPSLSDSSLAAAGPNDVGNSSQLVDELPLDLSCLDDWIYDNAFEQLCWQEQ